MDIYDSLPANNYIRRIPRDVFRFFVLKYLPPPSNGIAHINKNWRLCEFCLQMCNVTTIPSMDMLWIYALQHIDVIDENWMMCYNGRRHNCICCVKCYHDYDACEEGNGPVPICKWHQ